MRTKFEKQNYRLCVKENAKNKRRKIKKKKQVTVRREKINSQEEGRNCELNLKDVIVGYV